MATITTRLMLIGENYSSEPELDANSALTELDKGLRSNKIGEQCQAIVRFPKLFEKYPFPILINSACLKLAEVFRVGNSNFLRNLVFQVFQQSQKHLDKILNIDEFVRRIHGVIYCNDPVARALTLSTLGSISHIVAERKSIHHNIRNSLDSLAILELNAAIFATGKFASNSKIFACNICPKLKEMIEGLSTPTSIKLKLVTVFKHMHHDVQTASMVQKLCLDLLKRYPSKDFILVTLTTLTQLAANSLIEVETQINLLLDYLIEDPRKVVKKYALEGLLYLVANGSHMWTASHVEVLIDFTIKTPYPDISEKCIIVLGKLAQSLAVDKFDLSPSSKIHELFKNFAFNSAVDLTSATLQLINPLASHSYKEDKGQNLMEVACSAIEVLLLNIIMSSNEDHLPHLKSTLKSGIMLCEVNPDLNSQFVDVFGSLFLMTNFDFWLPPLCDSLAALGNRKPGILKLLQQNLVAKLSEIASYNSLDAKQTETLVKLCILLFQSDYTKINLNSVLKSDSWSVFKIGRQAARYGHHYIASDIFSHLSNKVSSEFLHFWLVALNQVSVAEMEVSKSIDKAIPMYCKALVSTRAATSFQHSLQFQCDYVRLRGEVLQSSQWLFHILACIKTAPPPAIAASVAIASRDDLQKSGRIVLQLRKCSKNFHSLAEQYSILYQSAFDADPKTLTNIQLLQQSCIFMAQAIDRVSQHSQGQSTWGDDLFSLECVHHSQEIKKLVDSCINASALIKDFQFDSRVIGKKESDHLKRINKELFQYPLPMPRFFFQTLQSTSIKLAITPQPKTPGEPVLMSSCSQLAVKVEGVVQHGTRPGLFRKVNKVLISIQSRAPNNNFEYKFPQETTSLSKTVAPHNDYFQAQFLLTFSFPGLHHVMVEAAVTDDNDFIWKTGPRMTFNVRCNDDGAQNKAQTRGPFTQRF